MSVLGGYDANFFVSINRAVLLNFMCYERIPQFTIHKACACRAWFRRKCSEAEGHVTKRSIHKALGLRRPINSYGLPGPRRVQPEEIVAHYIRQTQIVVCMKMGKENRFDMFRRDVCF